MRLFAVATLLLLLATLSPAPPAQADPIGADPILPGPRAFERDLYDFGERTFTKTGTSPTAYLIRLRGSIHVPEGDGPFPVVLFQHGRHATCRVVVTEALGPGLSRCPEAAPVVEPIGSYAGYDYIAQNLASHGFVVASVDAGDVNDVDATDQDAGAAARAFILLETLDELRAAHEGALSTPLGGRLAGKLDLARIGLMGHSRGGEGVTYTVGVNAARPSEDRHAIRAVFALAPIDATRVQVRGVAWATLLPYCDGDVTSLSGAVFYDDSRAVADGSPRSQILVMGANHNFYNTRWPQDDAAGFASDPACGTAARITAAEQRAEGLAHIAGFFRLHLAGEAAFSPLFDGSGTLPPSACPASRSCFDLVHVSYTSSERILVRASPSAADVTGASVTTCVPGSCVGTRAVGSAERGVVSWNGPALLSFPVGEPDASGHDALVVRVGVAALQGASLRIGVVDADGASATADARAVSRAVYVAPGQGTVRKIVLNDVRIPLDELDGVDLTRVAAVRLELGGLGVMHAADVAFQRS